MAFTTLVVTVKDEPAAESEVTPRVEVAFERKFNIPMSELSRQEHLYFLAYEARRKAGGVVPVVFDDWLDQVVDVEVKDAAPLGSGTSPTE